MLTLGRNDSVFDGAASIGVECLLSATAGVLANEACSLLIGESAAVPVVQELRRIVEQDPRVARVVEVLTMHLGPAEILLAVTFDFQEGLDRQDAAWRSTS